MILDAERDHVPSGGVDVTAVGRVLKLSDECLSCRTSGQTVGRVAGLWGEWLSCEGSG